MIGDVPRGAPLRCKFGRHVGQEDGGTMCFHCPRCGGTFWQPNDPRLRAAQATADRLIERDRAGEALRVAREAVREVHRGR